MLLIHGRGQSGYVRAHWRCCDRQGGGAAVIGDTERGDATLRLLVSVQPTTEVVTYRYGVS